MSEAAFMARGRCPNVDYCELAAARQVIELEAEGRFICPECAKPLRPVAMPRRRRWRLNGGAVMAVLLGCLIVGGIYAGYRLAMPVTIGGRVLN